MVRSEPTPNASSDASVMPLFARRRRLPPSARSRSVDHAQQCADPELLADLEPSVKLVPRPTVHPDLASLAARPAPDERRGIGPGRSPEARALRWSAAQRARAARSGREAGGRRGRSPTVRITAMISWTVGGSAGYCSPLFRGGRPRW